MNITTDFFLMIYLGVLLISVVGCVVLMLSTSATSRKYRALVLELKKRDQYEAWAKQHSQLVAVKSFMRYSGIVFILAIFIHFGILKDMIPAPTIVSLILGALIYVLWLVTFISMLIVSQLYKKIPELQN